MKKSIIIVCLSIVFCLYTTKAELPGTWSLALQFNYNTNFGISTAMRGTAKEFQDDLADNYHNYKLPFGDNRTKTLQTALLINYRMPESVFGFYFMCQGTNFSITTPGWFLNEKVSMSVLSFIPGMELTIGEQSDFFNYFMRGGISFNIINGTVEYLSYTTTVIPAFRGGFDIESGGRINISKTPLSFEFSAAYSNPNLIGKSYTRITVPTTQTIDERELNDGKNPDDPKDAARVIDYFSLRLGARISF